MAKPATRTRKAAPAELAATAPPAAATPAAELVPLARLKLHPGNTRKAGTRADIEALAHSIAGHGLINNLVATRSDNPDDDFLWVIAGGRRLAALQLLARQGHWPADRLVPVVVRDNDALTLEASVAENVQRQALSPMAEARAFARLLDEPGVDETGVAQRFGTTVRHVRQRLRLADLAPAVAKALDEGRITLDAAQAFASVPDQAVQATVFKGASQWLLNSPDSIRREMRTAADGERGSSIFARIVGQAAFRAAGGEIVEDLFSDIENSMGLPGGNSIWRPGDLLRRLFEQRQLETAAELARRHGFAGMIDEWPDEHECQTITLAEALAQGDEARANTWFMLDFTDREGPPRFEIAKLFLMNPGAAAPREQPAPIDPAPAPAAEPLAAEPDDDAAPALKLPAMVSAMCAMRRRDALAWALASASDYGPAIKLATFLLIERGPLGDLSGDTWGQMANATSISARPIDDPIQPGRDGHAWAGDDLDRALADAMAGGDLPLPMEWRQLAEPAARFAAFCELDFVDVLRWQAVATAATLKSGGGLGSAPGFHTAIAAQLAAAGVAVDVAEQWRPDADFFKRIGKAGCLAFLADVLGDEPSAWAKWKLAELAPACAAMAAGDHGKLGGLGHRDHKAAVSRALAWLPPGMAFVASDWAGQGA